MSAQLIVLLCLRVIFYTEKRCRPIITTDPVRKYDPRQLVVTCSCSKVIDHPYCNKSCKKKYLNDEATGGIGIAAYFGIVIIAMTIRYIYSVGRCREWIWYLCRPDFF